MFKHFLTKYFAHYKSFSGKINIRYTIPGINSGYYIWIEYIFGKTFWINAFQEFILSYYF